MTTYNRQSVQFTDETISILGNGCFPKSGIKKNHSLKVSKSGVEYVVNASNGFCYKSI
jgi:hypothetical protein